MRPVSACSSFRNQLPSRRQDGVLGWTESPWGQQFPVSRLGSGGGKEDGSKAGSRVSGVELDILVGGEVCLRGCCSMALSCPLGAELFTVWLLVQLLVLFTVGAASWGSWGSVSVFCLEAMLLSRLRLQRHVQHISSWGAVGWIRQWSDASIVFHSNSLRSASSTDSTWWRMMVEQHHRLHRDTKSQETLR